MVLACMQAYFTGFPTSDRSGTRDQSRRANRPERTRGDSSNQTGAFPIAIANTTRRL